MRAYYQGYMSKEAFGRGAEPPRPRENHAIHDFAGFGKRRALAGPTLRGPSGNPVPRPMMNAGGWFGESRGNPLGTGEIGKRYPRKPFEGLAGGRPEWAGQPLGNPLGTGGGRYPRKPSGKPGGLQEDWNRIGDIVKPRAQNLLDRIFPGRQAPTPPASPSVGGTSPRPHNTGAAPGRPLIPEGSVPRPAKELERPGKEVVQRAGDNATPWREEDNNWPMEVRPREKARAPSPRPRQGSGYPIPVFTPPRRETPSGGSGGGYPTVTQGGDRYPGLRPRPNN